MATIDLCRGELVAIPFTITDAASGLSGQRVTWSLTDYPPAVSPTAVLKKASGLGVSSADVTIGSQSASQISGTINVKAADYSSLPKLRYLASLWIDDGNGNDRCVSVDATGNASGGDTLNVLPASPR